MEFTVNVVFKEEYSQLVALFTHRYGYDKMELIEDAIQESFYKALKLWPNNPPKNPKGWLRTVTRNHLIDKFRERKYASLETIAFKESDQSEDWGDPREIRDNHLKMIFACCHPEIKPTDQLLLSLKFLCGFGTNQIARALLKSQAAVEKAISRARIKFKSVVKDLQVPQVGALSNRLEGVLKVIYLQFNEGYKVSEGSDLINKSLCVDAIRLAELLTTYQELDHPQIHALLALMYLQASRLDARINEQGQLITLDKQDRSKWNYKYILQGSIYLGKANSAPALSHYHVQASVASYHCAAPSYAETNWQGIISWYELGLKSGSNKNYELNKLIAFSQINTAAETLKNMRLERLPDNQFTQVFLGDLYFNTQQNSKAAACFKQALGYTKNQAEQDFIQSKLDQVTEKK